MSMRFVALHIKRIFNGLDRGAAPEENSESFNDRLREPGNIGDGGFDDFIAVSFGLSDEDGGGGVSVGDFLDIHGQAV